MRHVHREDAFFPSALKKNPRLVSWGQAAWIQVLSTTLTHRVTWSYLLSLSPGLLINKVTVPIAVRTQMTGVEFQLSASHRASVEAGAGEKPWEDCLGHLDVTRVRQGSTVQKSLRNSGSEGGSFHSKGNTQKCKAERGVRPEWVTRAALLGLEDRDG